MTSPDVALSEPAVAQASPASPAVTPTKAKKRHSSIIRYPDQIHSRIDPDLTASIRRLCTVTNKMESELVREALGLYCRTNDPIFAQRQQQKWQQCAEQG
jgi:hypothetical protein